MHLVQLIKSMLDTSWKRRAKMHRIASKHTIKIIISEREMQLGDLIVEGGQCHLRLSWIN